MLARHRSGRKTAKAVKSNSCLSYLILVSTNVWIFLRSGNSFSFIGMIGVLDQNTGANAWCLNSIVVQRITEGFFVLNRTGLHIHTFPRGRL